MKKMAIGVACLLCAGLTGCSTTKGTTVVLENRVQALENKVQVLEADVQSSVSVSPSSEMIVRSSGVTTETMSKKQIQEALKNAGYYEGEVDGKIGPRTKTAIKDFQADNGLTSDGVAGRRTKEKLIKYLQ